MWENVDRKSPDFASNSEPVNSFIEMELEEVLPTASSRFSAGRARKMLWQRRFCTPSSCKLSIGSQSTLHMLEKMEVLTVVKWINGTDGFTHVFFWVFSQATCIVKANVYGAAGKCLSRTATRVVAWMNCGAVCSGWIGLDVGTAKTVHCSKVSKQGKPL